MVQVAFTSQGTITMPIITLTTDMGIKDHYVAAVKGAILTQCAEATIVDISHHVAAFDITQAAFVLRNAFGEFPRGTIHIIGVNPEADGRTPHVVVRHDGHYFVGADNGIFSLLFDGKPHEVFELTMKLDADHLAFPVKNVLTKAACHIARGGTPEVIGRRTTELRELIGFRPTVDERSIRGTVLYVDGYGNVVTNITKALFDEQRKRRGFSIKSIKPGVEITELHNTYSDVSEGKQVAFFGDTGYLEVAVNKGVDGSGGSAARLFGLKVRDSIRIEFQ